MKLNTYDLCYLAENPLDPQLGELQDNGGLTKTLALQEGSPAIDAKSNSGYLTFDQRGLGFNRTIGNDTDIGAYEVQDGDGDMNEELVVSTLEDENDGDFSEGDLSLREAIALSNEREGADTITFNEDLSGGAIALDSSLGRDLTIRDSVFVAGLGRDNLTLDGSFIFDVEADTDLTLDGLNLIGGKIDSSGNLTFSNSSISQTAGIGSADNSAIISRGNATIVDSSVKDNDGGGLGSGGIKNFGTTNGSVTLTSSIVANNRGTDGSLPVGDLAGDGEFIGGGNNLIGNGDDVTGFIDGVNGDLVGSDGDDPFDPQTELLID